MHGARNGIYKNILGCLLCEAHVQCTCTLNELQINGEAVFPCTLVAFSILPKGNRLNFEWSVYTAVCWPGVIVLGIGFVLLTCKLT